MPSSILPSDLKTVNEEKNRRTTASPADTKKKCLRLLVDCDNISLVAPHEHAPLQAVQEELEVLHVQVGRVAHAWRRG